MAIAATALLLLLATGGNALADEIIIESHEVNLSLAYGHLATTGEVGDTFEELDLLYSTHYLSDELAGRLAEEYFGEDSPYAPLVRDYGALSNMDFLTGDLVYLGDPVQAILADYQAYLQAMEAAHPSPPTLTWTIWDRGMEHYGLYGGVVDSPPGYPGYDMLLVTGTAHVHFYQVNGVIEAGAAPVPEPATLLLLAAGLAGMGVWIKRRG